MNRLCRNLFFILALLAPTLSRADEKTDLLNQIWHAISAPAPEGETSVDVEKSRLLAYQDLEGYIGEYGVPGHVPPQVAEVIKNDIVQDLQFDSLIVARIASILLPPETERQVTDAYIMNILFYKPANTAIQTARAEILPPQILDAISALRTESVHKDLFQKIRYQAEIHAKYIYEGRTTMKEGKLPEEIVSELKKTTEDISSLISSFRAPILAKTLPIVFEDGQRDPEAFMTLTRALQICRFMKAGSPKLIGRYLEIILSKLTQNLIAHPTESELIMNQARAVSAELLGLFGDDKTVDRIKAIPDTVWPFDGWPRASALATLAKRGSQAALHELADEIFQLATERRTTAYSASPLDVPILLMSQLTLDDKTEAVMKKVMAIPEARMSFERLVGQAGANPETFLFRLPDIKTDSVETIQSFLALHSNNEAVLTGVFSQDIIPTSESEEEIEKILTRKAELGKVYIPYLLKRLTPNGENIVDLKKAGQAVIVASQFFAIEDPTVQLSITRLMHLSAFYSDNGEGDTHVAHDRNILSRVAFEALAHMRPQAFTEASLFELVRQQKITESDLKLIAQSKTNSTKVQKLLFDRLQGKSYSLPEKLRPLAMAALGRLNIVDPEFVRTLQKTFNKDSNLKGFALAYAGNLLVTSGLYSTPTDMDTVVKIKRHIWDHGNEYTYLVSVARQAEYLGQPKIIDKETGQSHLDRLGLLDAIQVPIQDFLAHSPVISKSDLEGLRDVIAVTKTLNMEDAETLRLIIKWTKSDAISLLQRTKAGSEYRDMVRQIRYKAIEVLGASGTNLKEVHEALVGALKDGEILIREKAFLALKELEEHGGKVTEVAEQHPDLMKNLQKNMNARKVRTLDAVAKCNLEFQRLRSLAQPPK